jgi:hypothetical protein
MGLSQMYVYTCIFSLLIFCRLRYCEVKGGYADLTRDVSDHNGSQIPGICRI